MIEITEITAGSPAAKAGIRVGDCLIAVNDTVIHDVLDYRFAITEKNLTVRFFREGEEQSVLIRKQEYEDPGLGFATALMDEKRTCGNHCIFCFIDNLVIEENLFIIQFFQLIDKSLQFLHSRRNMLRRHLPEVLFRPGDRVP